MKIKRYIFCIIIISGVFFASNLYAQCPMCKANVESSLKSGGRKTGLGLNTGIIMLLVMPYAVVGIVGGLWFVKSRKKVIK